MAERIEPEFEIDGKMFTLFSTSDFYLQSSLPVTYVTRIGQGSLKSVGRTPWARKCYTTIG